MHQVSGRGHARHREDCKEDSAMILCPRKPSGCPHLGLADTREPAAASCTVDAR